MKIHLIGFILLKDTPNKFTTNFSENIKNKIVRIKHFCEIDMNLSL